MKVWVNELPGAKLPLSKEPSSAVTVWVVESLFVQVTVLFTPITKVIVLGLNAKFWMVTLVVLWATATAGMKAGANPAANKAMARNDSTIATFLGRGFIRAVGPGRMFKRIS